MGKKIILTEDDLIEDLARFIASQSIKVMQATNSTKNQASKDKLLAKFISCYVENIVFSSLNTYVDTMDTKEHKFKYTSEKYGKLKEELTEQFALGFSKAMTEFSGQEVEYFCHITTLNNLGKNNIC